MAKQLAFYVDLSACSGCKACQVACKDKNDLEVGRIWRRVVEITGGEWVQRGTAWVNNVFTYNFPTACMHCQNPLCVDICPASAITKRADGVVLINEDLCIGCRYCEWACPYGAPQFHEAAGTMSKCNFCYDYLDQGLPPACVAACPLRALDFGDLSELHAKYGALGAVYPMPGDSTTEPSVIFTPHKDAVRARTEPIQIGNLEEV
jgi:anaerobic dimethyl sulfoxide reductase subunit B (iron-sulfur subunit)